MVRKNKEKEKEDFKRKSKKHSMIINLNQYEMGYTFYTSF